MVQMMNLNCKKFHRLIYIENILKKFLQAARRKFYAKIQKMSEESQEKILQIYGKRVQRCYGCYITYHLKDMYLGEDVTYFCEHCKDDSMFHFDIFSKFLDKSKLREVTEQDHHH